MSKAPLVLALIVCLSAVAAADDGDFANAAELARQGNFQDAVPLFQRLSDAGNPYASLTLADYYQNGRGVPKDDVIAAKLFEAAAAKSIVSAQRIVAQLYDQGVGVAKDTARAVSWSKRAAEQGDVLSQIRIGSAYEKGEGVGQDEAEAMRWFKLAAKQNAAAAFEVAALYGKRHDDKEEIEWTRKAADHGFPPALYNLGFAYSIGHGVPTDMVEAYRWLTLAALMAAKSPGKMFSPGDAIKARNNISARLTPAQRDTAELEVWKWLDKFVG
jgi:TPR repeat protein